MRPPAWPGTVPRSPTRSGPANRDRQADRQCAKGQTACIMAGYFYSNLTGTWTALGAVTSAYLDTSRVVRSRGHQPRLISSDLGLLLQYWNHGTFIFSYRLLWIIKAWITYDERHQNCRVMPRPCDRRTWHAIINIFNLQNHIPAISSRNVVLQ